MNINEKLIKLENEIKKQGKIAIAYSSGVDSTFLLRKARTIFSAKTLLR